MLKDTGYQEKFKILSEWIPSIIEMVKKDLKNEHLKVDRPFFKRYFIGKNFNRISTQEMAKAYSEEIALGNEGIGEFMASKWLLKNTDIYKFFEEALIKISPDFDKLDVLEEEKSLSLMKSAVSQFGAEKTYIFCVLNSVVFPSSIFEELRGLAEKSQAQKKDEG